MHYNTKINNGNILTCQNVALGYDGHIVISELNFSIQSEDYLCIVGENGVGKSTLANCILRLLNPIRGTITLSGEINRNEIGYLSQQTAAKKDFPAGVYEIIQSGNIGSMGLKPFYGAKEKQRTEETMKWLGIADLKDRCFRELSGGQQRRVLIGRALCASRKLLVLDEPFNAFAQKIQKRYYLFSLYFNTLFFYRNYYFIYLCNPHRRKCGDDKYFCIFIILGNQCS
jgi:zinc transport system ATP-binding protein